jgi:hypothetical protein
MTTTNLGLTKPVIGADSDTWGDELNVDLDLLDAFAGKLMGGDEVNVASLATCDIGAAASTAVAISGTTAITSLGTVANCIRFVRFTGSLTLNHNSTSLILLGAGNQQTAAGDTAIFKSDASGNWREVAYFSAAYTPASHTGTGAMVHDIAPSLQTATISGHLSLTGFGNTATLDQRTFSTTDGSGITVQCVSAGVILSNGATAWASASDERLKTAFTPFVSPLESVAKIKAGTGRYLTDPEGVSRSFLSAQSVQAVLPEAVTGGEGEFLNVRYTDAIPLLVAALAEAKARIEVLEAR